MEFLDRQTVASTFSFWKSRQPERMDALPDCLSRWIDQPTAPAVLLMEADGRPREASETAEAIMQIVKEQTQDAILTNDPETAESLWQLRRSCSQAMFELGPRKLNEDVVVPFEHQLDLLEIIEAIGEESGLPTPTFGHAADGNFHAHIMFDDADPLARDAARKAIQKLMEAVIALGGAISGEHGIGLAKAPFFHMQHGPEEIQVMKQLKATFDPNNILNPNKLWTRCEPWDFPRESVRMPWDH